MIKNIFNNKITQFLIILIILLFFLRIDYRFETTVKCCSDEYDYYSHAATIVDDFDLNYSNQDIRDFRYSQFNKNTPIGFFGTGLLSAPFLLIGSTLTSIFSENTSEIILNYRFLFYSMSSVIYFFLSYFLLCNTLINLNIQFNKLYLLLFFSGSGLTYFAFERFGMTHVYEVFGISLLINLSTKFYLNKNNTKNFYAVLIPLILCISFLTRMSNYYIFFIPYIIYGFTKDTGNKRNEELSKSIYFWSSSIISFLIYSIISNQLYGKLVLNPQEIYGTNISAQDIYESQSSFIELFISLLKTLSIILFSSEFGIFWVSPILFIGFISIFTRGKIFSISNIFIFLCFAQNFFIIHLWQALGSSYGFRYLFSLTPIAIMLYFIYIKKYSFLRVYLILFSIFSNLSILFFETTVKTQLSTTDEINSFGKIIRYIEPEYVYGLLSSFVQFESYLIIFTTSFFGVIIFKLIFLVFDKEGFISILENFGLPVQNQDFQLYLMEIDKVGFDKIILIVFLLSYFSYKIINSIKRY